ncbi:MAG: hypothetical protein ACRD5F_10345 [Candidatus Acidiferrales bacterium]
MNQETPESKGEGRDLRRSPRFELLVPIEVTWQKGGHPVSDRAEVIEASQHGGVLVMRAYPAIGASLELSNLLSGEKVTARAVGFRHSRDLNTSGLAIELEQPNATFWGITYRLRRASSELKALDEALKGGGGLDLRVLQEFRDAVDYVRKTAWVVYEWQERQVHHRDTATVMPLLTSERMRRATQLCYSILEDIVSMRPERYPGEISQFFQAVQLLHKRLDPILGPKRARVD